MAETINLGTVTAYGSAVEGGYTGTYNDFKQHMADFANIADEIEQGLTSKADLVNGKVPSSELPSYVDDVIEGYYKQADGKFYEESTYETEITGETGKIYVDLTTNNSYRWSGSAFVKINDVDITSKADKVSSATNGNFAGLDSNGNLTDSGKKASDFASSSAGVPTGGTTGQVLAKASGTDYDTEWVNASGGSGGHTIVNSSGSSMTARSKLKFANATVTDDSANDQTVITTNPASAVQTATLATQNFTKYQQDSGIYYITRSGFCEVQIKTIAPKITGQGLLVATGLPLSAIDGIIMGNTPNFEDGTAFYINTMNNTTSLYALIPDTGVKSGCVLYMMK